MSGLYLRRRRAPHHPGRPLDLFLREKAALALSASCSFAALARLARHIGALRRARARARLCGGLELCRGSLLRIFGFLCQAQRTQARRLGRLRLTRIGIGSDEFRRAVFCHIKYRYRCSGYATCQKKNFTARHPSFAALCRGIVCYLTDNLGRRSISDTLSAAQDYTRQTNACLSDIGVKSLVSRLRISLNELFVKTSSGIAHLGGDRSCRSTFCRPYHPLSGARKLTRRQTGPRRHCRDRRVGAVS